MRCPSFSCFDQIAYTSVCFSGCFCFYCVFISWIFIFCRPQFLHTFVSLYLWPKRAQANPPLGTRTRSAERCCHLEQDHRQEKTKVFTKFVLVTQYTMKICITSKVLYTVDAKIDSRFINSIVRHSMCNRVSFLKYMHSIKQGLHVLLIFFTGILLEFFHSITNLSLQENYYMQRSWFLSKLSLLNAKT